MGEGIDLARENYKPVPNTFRRILYHETGQTEFLGMFDRLRLRFDWKIPERHSVYSSTERELYYDIVSKFDLRNDYHYVRDLYQLLLSDLNDEATRRTTKIQTDYIFAENMSISFAIFSIISGLRIILGNEVETAIGLIFLLIGMLGAILLVIIFDLYGRVERTYVDKLVSEYFAYRTTQNNTGD